MGVMSLHSIICGSSPMTSFASDSEATTMQTRLGVYRKINMKVIKMMIINKRTTRILVEKALFIRILQGRIIFCFID